MKRGCAVPEAHNDDSQLFMPDLERVRVAVNALWEIDSLARAIGERCGELGASQLWIRGLAARLGDLAGAGMSVLDDGMPEALADARKTLCPWPGARGES